jgi:hypothetical protein
MKAIDRLADLEDRMRLLRGELETLDAELDGYDHRAKFEKAKACLRVLYRDHAYSSRSAWVNEVLDDPEVQGWIRERDS